MIKAPYNFVPVSEKVFFPDWADQISHDVPFKDGESGSITVKMTAHSPIYVRNGHKQTDNNDKEYLSFSKNQNEEYFIPGTSIKGMIRSVHEIMSFGKMEKVNEWTPTYRDLTNTETGKAYKSSMKGICCGWLTSLSSAESGYGIIDCGEPKRISHKVIDSKFNTNFESTFKYDSTNPKKKLNDEEKIASYKYKAISKSKEWSRNTLYDFKRIGNSGELCSTNDSDYTIKPCEFASISDSKFKANIVFTGQPGLRELKAPPKKSTGKHLEFLFEDIPEDKSENEPIQLSNKTFNNFLFAYYDKDPTNESKDWKYWKKHLNKGEKIPVFFKKNGSSILHFGLSYLYKLPYQFGIEEAIDNLGPNHKDSRLDLAEAMFGTEQNNNSLKGRVQFSIAKCINNCNKELESSKVVLSSPKASFYPTYIEEMSGYGIKTLKIKGRKRYPVHNSNAPVTNDGSDGVSTMFKPLAKGTEFRFMIRFHNLKKVELGSLITALTLNDINNKLDLFYSVGMGKPLRYGKVKLNIESINSEVLNFNNIHKYSEAFVRQIENDLDIIWQTETSIIELLTMAKEQKNISDELSYMKLTVGKDSNNEFTDAKKNEESLPIYSKIEGVKPVCFCTAEEWQNILDNYFEQNRLEDLKIKLKDFKDYLECKIALEQILIEREYNEDYKELYRRFPKSPSIIYKLLINEPFKELDKFIKDHLKKDTSLDKKDPATHKIFNYIFNHKYKNEIPPEGFSGGINSVKYSWEDIEITEDLICDLSARIWPPVKELQAYLEQSQLFNKKDLLELLNIELEVLGLI